MPSNSLEEEGIALGAKILERMSEDLANAFLEVKEFSRRSLKDVRLFAESYIEILKF